MGIKGSAESWARGRPARAIAVILAAGLVIGAAVGLGAGYKIEQHRVASSVKRLQVQLVSPTNQSTPGTTRPAASKSGLGSERVGTVTAVAADTIGLATKRLGVLQLHATSATRFERAVVGSKADITLGRRVLIPLGGREVLILPPSSPLGRPVTEVANGSFSVAKLTGSGSAVVSLANVRLIDTIAAAKRSNVKKGSKVIVAGRVATKGNFVAVEVIVLPAASAFAN